MTQYGYGVRHFKAFGGMSIHEYRDVHRGSIAESVRQLSDAELFGNEAELVAHLIERHQLNVPIVHLDQRNYEFVDSNSGSPVVSNRYATRPLRYAEYTLPVSGQILLLEIQPQSTQMIGFNGLPEVYIKQGAISFYVPDYGGNPQDMANSAKQVLDNLRVNSEQLARELESINQGTSAITQQAVTFEIQRREQERQRDKDLRDLLP